MSLSMKASVSPRASKYALCLILLATSVSSRAQDVLVLKNGQRRDVQVLGVSEGRVRFKAGPAETTLPLDQVASVRMQAPKAFDDAVNVWKTGDAAKTLPVLKPLVENFRSLPTPWAERASALLGNVLLEAGDVAGAEAAFAAFQQAYPDATGLADIGLARLAVEKKDFATATTKLAPIVEAGRKTLLAETGKSSEYGQAFYLMGNVLENDGKFPEALEHYLLAVTIFYEDTAVVARAQSRADALIKEKNVSVP
jgi:predicted Zn-dependent protease